MRNHWYIACRSRQLKRKPIPRTVLGEPLALFRDQEGNAAALIDRCLHRNMALSRGKVDACGLRCCYHGWTYDASGRCTAIPAAPTGGVPETGLRLKSYPVVEKQGFVWVYIGGGEPGHQPPDFPEFGARGWRHWVMEREFEAAAFHCVENFLDVPHTAHVHRGLFRGKKVKEIEIEVTGGADWIQADFVGEGRMDSLIGRLLIPKGAEIVHTDRFTLPYLTRVDYRMAENRQYIVMSQCTPVAPDKTRVFTYMAYRFSPLGGLVGLVFRPLSKVILNQDVVVLRKQTGDLNRTGEARFVYHETDAIARGIRELLDGGSLEGRPPDRKKIRA